jgi:hypothetical protein
VFNRDFDVVQSIFVCAGKVNPLFNINSLNLIYSLDLFVFQKSQDKHYKNVEIQGFFLYFYIVFSYVFVKHKN